jgi:hypothetical protein
MVIGRVAFLSLCHPSGVEVPAWERCYIPKGGRRNPQKNGNEDFADFADFADIQVL